MAHDGYDSGPLTARRFRLLLAAIMAGAGALYVARNPQYKTGSLNDDAVYVIASGDLDNSDLSRLYPAIKPDRPLPGLPILLAPATNLSAPGQYLFEWVMPVVAVASLLVLALWCRRWLSAGETLVAVALYAFNPIVARYAGIVVPASAFTAAAVGSFLLLGRLTERPTTGDALALGFVAGWGSLLRPEGPLLALCVVLPALFSGRARRHAPALGLGLSFWLVVAIVWFRTHRAANTEYGSDVSALVVYWSHHFLAGLKFSGRLLRVFLVNTGTGLRLPGTAAADVARAAIIALWLLIAVSGARSIAKTASALEFRSVLLFCFAFFGVHLFWHVAQDRYFVPLLPFLLVFLVRGAADALGKSSGKFPWVKAATLLLVTVYGIRNVAALGESLATPDPLKSPPWQSLEWLKENADPGDKVVSLLAPAVTLYADLPSTTNVKTTGVEDFVFDRFERGYRYIVDRPLVMITPGVGNTADYNRQWSRVRRWIRRYPDRFPRVYSNPYEKVTIYEIRPEPHFIEAYRTYRQAAAYFLEGKPEKAFVSAQRSLAAFPDMGSALNLLGALYVMQSDYSTGERYFLRSLKVRPESSVAMLNLAALYRRLGLTDLSRRYADLGLQASAKNGKERLFRRNLEKAMAPSGMLFIDAPQPS